MLGLEMVWLIPIIIAQLILPLSVNCGSHSPKLKKPIDPSFISESMSLAFRNGENISLPCDVSNAGQFMIAWKRGIAILTAGKVRVSPDHRIGLVNGYTLLIRDATTADAGEYVCQIATLQPIEIVHKVDILVEPKIEHVTSSGHLQVKKGASVRLECMASGNPAPNITWSRKNNILPDGEEKLSSSVLTIENMDRHKGGTYVCTASNEVGQPATSEALLHVLYPPEVAFERPIIYSGTGQEAMIVCIVHGEVPPEVTWYKDTMQLDTTERHIMESRGTRHTLLIRNVHLNDFGNYTCAAENQMGKAKRTIVLTGKPKMAIFHSPQLSEFGDRYNISWAVDSHTPVEEFKLFFRRLPKDYMNNDNDEDSGGQQNRLSERMGVPLQYQNSHQPNGRRGFRHNNGELIHRTVSSAHSGGGGTYLYYDGYGNVAHWSGDEWRDVILPAMPLSHLYTQPMSYLIHGLEPEQRYEAKVQARNRYGWSDVSIPFVFGTASSKSKMLDLRAHSNAKSLRWNSKHHMPITYYCATVILLLITLKRSTSAGIGTMAIATTSTGATISNNRNCNKIIPLGE